MAGYPRSGSSPSRGFSRQVLAARPTTLLYLWRGWLGKARAGWKPAPTDGEAVVVPARGRDGTASRWAERKGRAMRDWFGWLWDVDLILAVQRRFGPEWRLVAEALSLLGGAQITLVAVAWARWFHSRRLAGRLLVILFLGVAVNLLLWNLFYVPRPTDPPVRVTTVIPISSFPSGHTVTAVALWGTLALEGVFPWAGVAAIAFLIALGRLHGGAHYPGDLLGGLLIGAADLAAVARLWRWLPDWLARRPWRQQWRAAVATAALATAVLVVVPQPRWSLPGLLAGVALALPLEARWIGFDPARLPWRQRLLKAGIGAAGIGVLALASEALETVPLVDGFLLPALAALWILLGAPALFRRRDWSLRAGPALPPLPAETAPHRPSRPF